VSLRGFESPTLRGGTVGRGADEVTVADGGRGRHGRVVNDPVRRARFQPLLLVGAFLTVLPAIAASGHPARPWLFAGGVGFALLGTAAWWWGERRAVTDVRRRERLAVLITATTTPAFLALVAVLGAQRPEAFLPMGAALVASMAPVTLRVVRMPVQLLTVVFFAVLLLQAGRSAADVLLPLVLLVSIGILATTLARELVDIRGAERRARRDAQRRTELLTAVRALPGSSLEEASAAACSTMRALGFDAAGCAVRHGDHVVTLHIDGLPPIPRPLAVGEGLAGTCIAEDRTIVIGDYQADDRRLDARTHIGSAVVVPIRVDGRAVGSLMGARTERGDPSEAEVEVAEVLAAHLSAVFSTDRTVRRQRELLARMEQLDTMRSGFVAQVSDELRDPLTVVRGIAETLVAHGPVLDHDRRVQLFDRMGSQTDQLRRTIDALLDFSRFQSSRPEPAIGPILVWDLLLPIRRSTDAEVVASEDVLATMVHVDAELVDHTLELLLGATAVQRAAPRLEVTGDGGAVRIAVHADTEGNAAPTLVRSLAAQLLVMAGGELDHDPAPVLVLPAVVAEAASV
jgi:K+-sensing histidine kinase KdpD